MFWYLWCLFCLTCRIESFKTGLHRKFHNFGVASHRRYLERVRKIFHPPPKGFASLDIQKKKDDDTVNDDLVTNLTRECEKEWLSKYPYLSMRNIWEKYIYSGTIKKGEVSGRLMISKHVKRPNYYKTGTPTLVSYDDPSGLIKSDAEIEGIKKACLIARKILDSVHPFIRSGVMTDTIDRHIHRMCDRYNVYPSPLRYKGFPKSVCVSINEIVCHGIPDSNILATGDFVNIDVTVYADGYHGDVSETFLVLPDSAFSKGEYGNREPVSIGGYEQKKMQRLAVIRKYVQSGRIDQSVLQGFEDRLNRDILKKSPEGGFFGINEATKHSGLKLSPRYLEGLKGFNAKIGKPKGDKITESILPYSNKLLKSAYNATMAAIEVCGPGVPFKAIGDAIESVIERDGFYTTPHLVGHGIGKNFHEEPNILFVRNNGSEQMLPGMVFTIEPVIFEKKCNMINWPDGWTIATDDGSRTAQYEHTIAITNEGVEVLTKRLQTSPSLYFLDDTQLSKRVERLKSLVERACA